MKSRIISMFLLPILIIVFMFGVLYVQAQDTEKNEAPEKKDTPENKDNEAEKDNKDAPKELTLEELNVKVNELIKKLESDDFKEREAATEELFKLGEKAIPIIEEAIKKATDPEIKSKLSSVIEKYEQLKKETEEKKSRPSLGNPGFTLRFKLDDKTSNNLTIVDGTGTYNMQKQKDGKVKVTAKPNGGEEETREFESMKEFEEEWPEVFAKFKVIKLKLIPAQPPKGFEDDDDEEDSQPNDIPEEMAKEIERLRKMFEDMMRGLNPGFDDDDDDFPGRPEGLPEDLEKEFERMKKEMEKRLGKEFGKEIDPKEGESGHKQFYRSSRKDLEGNTYILTIEDGKVTAEFKSKDGETITKHYENVAEFKKDWKEFADLFPFIDNEYKPYKSRESSQSKGLGTVEDAVLDVLSAVLRAQLKIKEGEGLLIRELVGELDETKGLFKKAGFEKFDILLEINGKSITDIEILKNAFKELKPGEKLVIKYIRKGSRQEITITK